MKQIKHSRTIGPFLFWRARVLKIHRGYDNDSIIYKSEVIRQKTPKMQKNPLITDNIGSV